MSHYQNFTPPFEIHDSWEWVRLDDIAQSNIGLTYKPTDVSKDGTPVYRSNNIQNRSICKDDIVRVNSEILSNQFLHEGDLLICARNGSRRLVGKNAIIQKLDEPTSFGAFMAVCRSAYNSWIHILLNTRYFDRYLDASNSTAINQVTQKMLLDFTIPFPPIREQNRIISILSMWFNILDDMDKKSEDLKTTISNTKSKILELAMQGKLVPQNPTDEPAADMLLRVNPKARIITDNPHYPQLPDNWCSISILDCGNSALGKTLDREKNEGSTVPYICALNVQDGWFDLSTIKYFRLREHEKERYSVYKGDLMICEGGDVGRCAIWDQEPIFYQNALHRLRPHEGINTVFISLVLSHYRSNGWIDDLCSGVTIKHFTQKSMSKMIIGLPPTKEQDRIVKEVNRIFSSLDRIMLNLSDFQLYQVPH